MYHLVVNYCSDIHYECYELKGVRGCHACCHVEGPFPHAMLMSARLLPLLPFYPHPSYQCLLPRYPRIRGSDVREVKVSRVGPFVMQVPTHSITNLSQKAMAVDEYRG